MSPNAPAQAVPNEMATQGPSSEEMAIYEQMRQQISPQEFSNEMLAGASQVDPQAVAEFTQELQGLDMPPEVLNALNDVVDEILANPQQYAEIRVEYLEAGLPEDILPEQFDPQFFAALNMAIDQMIAAPTGVQAFAQGGIAELKPIAKAIASYGRNGDTMLAHITPAEARMLRRRGGSGTINPDTGLPEFFVKKLWDKTVGKVIKSVGKQLKSIGKAVKKFAQSSIGRVVLPIALGFFLGPAAASFLGVGSVAGVAAVSGFVGGAGSTLLAGGNLKDALRSGAVAGVTAGAGAGLMGGAGAFQAGSASTAGLTPGQAFQGQVDKFTGMFSPGAAAQAPVPQAGTTTEGLGANQMPVPDADPLGNFMQQQDASFVARNTAAGMPTGAAPGSSAYDLNMQAQEAARANMPATVGQAGAAAPAASSVPSSTFMDQAKGFFKDTFSPSGIREAAIPGAQNAGSSAVSDLLKRVPTATPAMQEAAYQTAYKAAMPGVLSTYGPAVGAGLGIMALSGGFDAKPVEGGDITRSLQTSSIDRMRQAGTQRENYMQNLPGVVYDEAGEPLYGQASPFSAYTSPGFATATSFNPGAAPSMYAPPVGSLTNTPGGIAQPYNNSNMYSNLMSPSMAPRRYADGGGIAALGRGGYPRRTGQISGPGTEKSDSIPAMLSDGEFVMTAAAVRGAGKGNRRAGAKQMYKLMHQLEKNSERG